MAHLHWKSGQVAAPLATLSGGCCARLPTIEGWPATATARGTPTMLASCIPDELELHRSLTTHPSTTEDAMAKGQMRSNKEKKKPKQDKNIKKAGAAPAPSPFANMHSQSGKKS